MADGRLAATLAALSACAHVVLAGGAAAFLASFPVGVLADLDVVERPLAELFHRLGLRTLGQLAALPAADVLGRFGSPGALAHRSAAALDDRPPSPLPTARADRPADVRTAGAPERTGGVRGQAPG